MKSVVQFEARNVYRETTSIELFADLVPSWEEPIPFEFLHGATALRKRHVVAWHDLLQRQRRLELGSFPPKYNYESLRSNTVSHCEQVAKTCQLLDAPCQACIRERAATPVCL